MDYSKRDVYESTIREHVKKVLLLCEREGIPMFMTFALENTKNGTNYVVEMLSAASEGVTLKDDHIAKHALVVNGFELIPKKASLIMKDVLEVEGADDKPDSSDS